MLRTVLLFVNQRKQSAQLVASEITDWCAMHGVQVVAHSYKSSPLDNDEDLARYQQGISDLSLDLIIVIGGDGTLLRAARAFASLHIPIMPISSGKLAFLMYIKATQALKALDDLHGRKKMGVEKRLMLKGTFLPRGRPIYALNEIVITLEDRTRMTEFSVRIAQTLINTYRSDGLIVCTATGSSAYNLSAGGPLIYPANRSIIMTPICSHSLSTRPIVLSPDHPIEIQLPVDAKHALSIIADGQEKRLLNPGQTLVIKRSPDTLHLVKSPHATSYFEALRDKLLWH